MREITYKEAITEALKQSMKKDKSIFVYEKEECWEIEEYYDNKIITACECTLMENNDE